MLFLYSSDLSSMCLFCIPLMLCCRMLRVLCCVCVLGALGGVGGGVEGEGIVAPPTPPQGR